MSNSALNRSAYGRESQYSRSFGSSPSRYLWTTFAIRLVSVSMFFSYAKPVAMEWRPAYHDTLAVDLLPVFCLFTEPMYPTLVSEPRHTYRRPANGGQQSNEPMESDS